MVQKHPARVVPGIGVLRSGVAEPCDSAHRSGLLVAFLGLVAALGADELWLGRFADQVFVFLFNDFLGS
jgi:hypothetical protein